MQKNSKSTYLFVDGSNLYAGQYELFGPRQYLDFSMFIEEIERKGGIKFDKIYFYTSYSPKPKKPTEKEKLYLKNEALFYRSVRKTKNVVFFKGYRSKTSGKEKEVDVKLAVDIVEKAALGEYDSLYLLSGDADFMEALFSARRFYRKVHVLCLENKIMYKSFRFFETYVLIFFPTFSPRFFNLERIRKLKRLILSKKDLLRKM